MSSQSNNVANYGWKNPEGPQSCSYLIPEILKISQSLKIHRIADLGCGNGTLCGRLKAAGFDVVGIEYDKEGHELAKKNVPAVSFYNFGVQDDPADLMKSEAPFDAVISTEVIEHLYSPHLLPIYAKSILKRDGFLIVSTPYHGYLKNLALAIFNHWDTHHTPLWHGGHIKFWSRKTLSQLLTENGFRVIGFRGVGRTWFLWKSMVLIAQRTP